MTLHQLRIFWAVAHARSFTKASKVLGLAQPSLSQQISKLEEDLGTQLFNRNRNDLDLTDAGKFLARKTELILSSVDEAVVGLKEFAQGTRGVIAVGALSSIARILLPQAVHMLARDYPEIEVDVHETAPAEALDLLYGRRLSMALLATDSIASSSVSFHQTDLLVDPYVLAVPRGIDLAGISDLGKGLSDTGHSILNSTIHFNFGTQHKRRIEAWYQQVLPHYRVVGQTRTYEVALSMVQEGVGVAVVPALTASLGAGRSFDVTLYRTTLPDRRIVALTPSQYVRVEPFASFIRLLRSAAEAIVLPPIEPVPPLLERL